MDTGTFQLLAVATDGGATPLSGSTTLSVRVRNCTTQTFMFDSNYYYFEIDEGSNQFLNSSLANIQLGLSNVDTAYFSPDYMENPLESVGSATVSESHSVDQSFK